MGDKDSVAKPLDDSGDSSRSSEEYEQKTDHYLSGSDTIVVAGSGAKIQVKNHRLVIQHGRTHVPQQENAVTLYAGVHRIRRLVIATELGYVTLGAFHWCRAQGISILMLDRDAQDSSRTRP